MSKAETKTHRFQAKNSLWYSSYQEMALSNRKTNDEYLRSKGLLDTAKKLKNTTPSRKKTYAKRARIVTPTPTRRSRRMRRAPPQNGGLKLDFLEPARTKPKASKKAGPRGKREVLTDEDLKALQNVPDWLEEMEEFLLTVPHGGGNRVVGESNAASVMRQVQKLVSGLGITYHHWGEGTYFKRGVKIHLGMNFDNLYDEAVEMENNHGRDLGNGWLLRHPITKLKNFQQYKATVKRKS